MLFAAIVLLFVGQTVAHADPVIQPGCTSSSHTSKWGNSTYPTYQYQLSVRWCWTGGALSNVHVNSVSGSGYASATTIFQTTNATGPTDINRAPISAGASFGQSVTVYGWFQSRDCATGPLNLVCSSWTWHRMAATLGYSGRVSFSQQS